ncbi:TraB/GumN family protein [Ahrensia sp. R2A130]|uniref:TraB/GumN family protein n=1 Tax=Ahrensia sp. R2A130 TaxID=744979 RepID=UPI0001E08427|nr:TraB/GumN family protein [Ahrensia sp. R2A130]EFL88066.1 GumN family protein [Ahrensia sp. R2A130]
MLKSLTLAASLTLALSGAAFAEETPKADTPAEFVCTGQNLMEEIARTQPELADEIDKAAAEVPYGKGLLWKVTKGDAKPSYIFGTMHMSDPRLLELPEKAEAAFTESTTLALEITEILDPSKMAGQAMMMMQYTAYLDGSTLDSRMKPDDIAMVTERLREAAGLPWSVAAKLKPWTVMGAIALPGCELARKRAGKPFLDMDLGNRAKADGKRIEGLESLEGQLKAMSSLPEDMMIKALVDTAKMGERIDDLFETMLVLYTEGEIAKIWTMLTKLEQANAFADADVEASTESSYTQFQVAIVDNRNVGMAERSAELATEGGAFIAMGALHLPGEKGVLKLLEDKGFTVERP